MAPAATLEEEPSSTTATVFYSNPPVDGSYGFVSGYASPVTGKRESNVTGNPVTVKINNIRTATTPITLDGTGFEVRHAPSAFSQDPTNFSSDAKIEADYYPEIRFLLLAATGAKEATIFEHTIRRNNPGEAELDESKRQPVSRVHVDQTTKATHDRVRLHHPDRADDLLSRRVQLINVWRPIQHVASDHPLACAVYGTIDPVADLIPTLLDNPPPMPKGELYSVKYNPKHEWYYAKDMQVDELMMIKIFDSEGLKEGSDVAVMAPHTAFDDPATPADAPKRQSIEVRCLLFY
ncbi:hypothetical protein Dda_3117 [Drechslerella dactyloides]|uniref:Methyltransferase n=1 Tax=Drechslerella dactyloides TaxID=74499 RepID=A0AAD6J0W3_DREDA|nr:hypothetical protein Dda_3117 [Drechslerella dactyloides]